MKKSVFLLFSLLYISISCLAQKDPKGLALHDSAPDFTITDQDGNNWQLSKALEKGAVVLVFYRGHWCPHCNKYLSALQDSLPAFERKGASLIAVTPEMSEGIDQTVTKTKASYPILHDESMRIMKMYDVDYAMDEKTISAYKGYGLDMEKLNGTENGTNLPVPAVFVINKEGLIIFRHFDKDYTKRAKISEVLASIE